MPTKSTKHVITVSSSISRSCAYCRQWIDGERWQEGVNHYLQEHGCELLHVGTDTSHDMDGKPWYGTIAVLGSQVVPPPLEPFGVVVVPPKVSE